jgi:uncharacterized Zn finger protein
MSLNISAMTAKTITLLCSRCGAQQKLIHTLLNPQKRHTIRMYRCQCGEQTWTSELE